MRIKKNMIQFKKNLIKQTMFGNIIKKLIIKIIYLNNIKIYKKL